MTTQLPTLSFPGQPIPANPLLARFAAQNALMRTFSNPAIWRGMHAERMREGHVDPIVNNLMLARLSAIESALRDGRDLGEISEFLEWLEGTRIWPCHET